jgi:hypothetical protein
MVGHGNLLETTTQREELGVGTYRRVSSYDVPWVYAAEAQPRAAKTLQQQAVAMRRSPH